MSCCWNISVQSFVDGPHRHAIIICKRAIGDGKCAHEQALLCLGKFGAYCECYLCGFIKTHAIYRKNPQGPSAALPLL